MLPVPQLWEFRPAPGRLLVVQVADLGGGDPRDRVLIGSVLEDNTGAFAAGALVCYREYAGYELERCLVLRPEDIIALARRVE